MTTVPQQLSDFQTYGTPPLRSVMGGASQGCGTALCFLAGRCPHSSQPRVSPGCPSQAADPCGPPFSSHGDLGWLSLGVAAPRGPSGAAAKGEEACVTGMPKHTLLDATVGWPSSSQERLRGILTWLILFRSYKRKNGVNGTF